MTDMAGHDEPGDVIPHQDAVEGVVDSVIEDASTQAAIANFVAITGGESPTETEFNALGAKVNQVLGVLRDLGAIPST